MLEFTSENVLEGIVAPSDCEKNLRFRGLVVSTGSFYIGDNEATKIQMREWLDGSRQCLIDSLSFFSYLDDIEEVVNKFNYMFHGPVGILENNREHFLNLSDYERQIKISYKYPDRYLKTSLLDSNMREFKTSLIGYITHIKFEKDENANYKVYVNLVDDWETQIMQRNPSWTNDVIVSIFNDFMIEGSNNEKDMIEQAVLFGVRYAALIKNNEIDIEYVVSNSNFQHNNLLENVNEGILIAENTILNNQTNDNPPQYNVKELKKCKNRKKGGENVILYGVPGSGKSWTIKNEYCDDKNKIERVVFHPDYTYSDFIGQILPQIEDEEKVVYKFTAGPFTKVIKEAFTHPNEMYYLIIEEINRGNAPAIFGDMFQLLDRDDDGNSEYEITNSNVAEIVYGKRNANEKVSIPSNMSILCTMNTSDQNVFTLDTAFQRRWNMRLVRNKFDETISGEEALPNTKILDTDVTWGKFFKVINDTILGKNIRMTSSEDKRLGTHFIKKEDLSFDEEKDDNGNMTLKARRQNSKFPEKVIKYLWDDAFKFTRDDVFNTEENKSLEDLIDNFITNVGNNRFKIFKENIYDALFE